MEKEKKNGSDIAEVEEGDEAKWVSDSSVDHQGRLPLRASTGVWKASLFIICLEFSERLCNCGITANLISYFSNVMRQDLKTAAKNVTYWSGMNTITTLAGGLLADAYTGRFSMILYSSLIYLLSLGLLIMSQYIPSLKPCSTTTIPCSKPRKIHEVLFFLALYLISLGTGGHKPCLQSFGADQFDDDHTEERKKKLSFFNWWNIALCCAIFLGVTVVAYFEEKVSWGAALLILTVTMAVTIVTFYIGRPYYRYRSPEGSPLIPLLQVFVSAIRKRNLKCPDPSLLHEIPRSKLSKGRLLCHTRRLRFLDKAALIEEKENTSSMRTQNPWRLATLTRVEEAKLVLSMIPIWAISLPMGVNNAQGSTFFLKQAALMNRRISKHFEIPSASISTLTAIGMVTSVAIYDRILVPILRRITGSERGIKILQRIGIGMVFPILSMVMAALVERKRLSLVKDGGQTWSMMSVFWLAPQYLMLGMGDGFTLVGLQEYFYDQVPDSMRSLGLAFYLSALGIGTLLNSCLITVVDHFSTKGWRSWFGKDLNLSHVDRFYWLLAVLNGLNLCVFWIFARRYTYKDVDRALASDGDEDDVA